MFSHFSPTRGTSCLRTVNSDVMAFNCTTIVAHARNRVHLSDQRPDTAQVSREL